MNPQQPISLTDVVAFWGAITGTISLVVAYFTYKRDDIKIKVDVKKGWRVVRSSDHDPNEDQVVVTVSNKGRRPVTITKIAYQFLKKDFGVIWADSMQFGSRELIEGKSTDYIMLQSKIDDFSEISYFSAYDAVGNAYKKYVTPFYKRFFYWIIFSLHLKKKEKLKEKRKNKSTEGKGIVEST